MILTAEQIEKEVHAGGITICPFSKVQLSPNSYDFRLGSRCRTYVGDVLDSARENKSFEVEIPGTGLVLEPSKIYLINSEETIGSRLFVPVIRGRSSVGRLGIFIHITADLIDLGSVNQFTLQLHVVQPVVVYPGMLIGQVTFWVPLGDLASYEGKYAGSQSPCASLSYMDFNLRSNDAEPR
jgi:dCTP deaminase